MLSTVADVVIVGCGPAGASTALQLSRAGFDVLLLDRQAFPRPKPCGDCLSPQASRLLEELGVLDRVLALEPATLEGWRVVSPAGFAFSGRFRDLSPDPLTDCAIAVERSRLDRILLEASLRAGARLWTGARVSEVAAGGVRGVRDGEAFHVRARLVVGADGLRSVVARRLGLALPPGRRKLSLTAHVSGRGLEAPGYGAMHVGRDLCAGIAPVTRDAAAWNVTVVADSRRHGRSVAADPAAFFRAALDSLPAVRHRARHFDLGDPGGGTASTVLLASGPFDVPTRRTTGPGFALVGDAAGYFDPFTGQGIFQALAGGLILADEAETALRRFPGVLPGLRHYAARHRSLVRGARFVQRAIDAVLSRPALADFAIRRLDASVPARNALLAATGDLAPATSVFAPATLLAFAGIGFRRAA